MPRDPFLDDPDEPGGCLWWLLYAWGSVIASAVLAVALGPLAGLAMAGVLGGAALAVGLSYDGADGGDRHPAAGATVRRPATAGGAWVVAVAPPAPGDVLFNRSDPGCEVCQGDPGRAAGGAPCPCTRGGRRW